MKLRFPGSSLLESPGGFETDVNRLDMPQNLIEVLGETLSTG